MATGLKKVSLQTMKLNRQELFKSIGFLGAGLLIAGYLRYTFQEIMGKFNATLLIAGGVASTPPPAWRR
jgi:hypothetical protein